MFGFFKKVQVGAGAMTILKRMGYQKNARDYFYDRAEEIGLPEATAKLRIPQQIRSLLLLLKTTFWLMESDGMNGKSTDDLIIIILLALRTQLKACTMDEKRIFLDDLLMFMRLITTIDTTRSEVVSTLELPSCLIEQ